MRNPCKDCIYYHKASQTCQSKKCATDNDGKVAWIDRMFCSPRKDEWMRKYELESYEASLESVQRALIDIKDIAQRISGLGRVRQSQTALDALQEIVEIVDQEV